MGVGERPSSRGGVEGEDRLDREGGPDRAPMPVARMYLSLIKAPRRRTTSRASVTVAGWNWVLRCDMFPALTGRQGSWRLISSLGLSCPHAHLPTHSFGRDVCDDGWVACREGRCWQPGSHSIGTCIRTAQGAADGPVRASRAAQDSDAVWPLRLWQARHPPAGLGIGSRLGRAVDRARGIDLALAAANLERREHWDLASLVRWRFVFAPERWDGSGCCG